MTTNHFSSGLNTDTHPKYLEPGEYTYALNAVLETEDGDIFTVANELGNSICAELPENKKIIGHSLTDTSDIVVFLFDPKESRPVHEIGIFDPIGCTYTTIVKDEFLNFSDKHTISAFVRIKNGCNRMLYWTDNYNPYRVANITDTTDWVNPAYLSLIDDSLISFSRNYGLHPYPTTVDATQTFVKSSGGLLEYGTYSFYIRYLDWDLNPTCEWIPFTNYISVGYGHESNINSTIINGADNNISSPLFKPKANKSIHFKINDLSLLFKYYQLAVVKKTAQDGSTSSIDVLLPRDITSPIEDYSYTGDESQIVGVIPYEELLTPLERIDRVVTHVVDNDTLFLGGTTKDVNNYTGYQRAASKVKITYQATSNDTYSSSNSYFDVFPITMNPDEVEALGMVFIYDSGEVSPVFHIPGRPVNSVPIDSGHYNYKISTYTDWDTDDLTGSEDIYNDDKTLRWQVYSTASIDTTTATPETFNGYLGYHENELTYPDVPSCDDHVDGYWGRDWQDNLIEPGVTKIRHHRMPPQWNYTDSLTDPADHPQFRYQLVVDTSTIEYPADNIIGYYIVVGDHTFDKTVLDRGLIVPMSYDVNSADVNAFYYAYPDWGSIYWPIEADRDLMTSHAFISPHTLFETASNEGAYVSVEKLLTSSSTVSATVKEDLYTLDITEFASSFNAHTKLLRYTTFEAPKYRLNYKLLSSNRMDPTTIVIGDDQTPASGSAQYTTSTIGNRVENRSKNSGIIHIELEEPLQELQDLTLGPLAGTAAEPFTNVLATIKLDRDVFTNLFNITYHKLSPSPSTELEASIVINSGTQYIPYVDMLETFWDTGDVYAHGVTTPIVHPINTQFRYNSDIDRGRYSSFKIPLTYDHSLLRTYLISKYYEVVADEGSFFPEYYDINDSYKSLLNDKPYFPLAYDYEYCSDCIERHPYRIYYSEKDYAEERVDRLRRILPSNYRDVDGSTGPITSLVKSFEQVIVHTTQAPWFAYTRPQSLTSDAASIYIGTGEVLALPFKKISSPDFALGGISNFKHGISTEFGYAFIDELSGRPMLIAGSLQDISGKSRNFWEKNAAFNLKKQFKNLTQADYPLTTTTNKNGIGYSLGYDPRFKRLIVHKTDYKILPNYAMSFQYSPNVVLSTPDILWFDGNKYWNNGHEITLGDANFFENKSFTISYWFNRQRWVSFHTYQPYYMMNDYDTFYSNGTWKHNTGNYNEFYGEYALHVIDFVALNNPALIQYTSNIFYSSNVLGYDDATNEFKHLPETYDGVIVYNTNQSTGYQILNQVTPDNAYNEDNSNNFVPIRITDKQWRLNNIRDLVINPNQSIWNSSWVALSPTPYLDKVPNTSNLNFNASLFAQPRIRDYYTGIRFFFNPTSNKKIVTDLVHTRTANRNR